MDLARIQRRGRSTTGKGWLTNRLRRALWRLIVPYYEGVVEENATDLAALRDQGDIRLQTGLSRISAEMDRRDAALRENYETAMISRLTAMDAQINADTHRLAGFEKNFAAFGHRLAGIEEGLARGEASAGLVEELRGRMETQVAALHQRLDAVERNRPLRDGDRVAIGQGNIVLAAMGSGARLLVRTHDLIGRIIMDGGEWEPHVREQIERAARPDSVAVDAGAYIGLHTVTMARCFRTVHAFEPQFPVFEMLCANLAMNDCINVIPHNLALYDEELSMRLAPPERQESPVPQRDGRPDYARIGNAAGLTFEVAMDDRDTIRAVPLDALAIKDVGLIKVDTQGADLRVLRGAVATLQRCRPMVLFEYERDLGAQHGTMLDDFFSFFASIDYEVTMLHEVSPERQADYIAKPR